MSGPKSARYEVVSNAELRRRALDAAREAARGTARKVLAFEEQLAQARLADGDVQWDLDIDVPTINLANSDRAALDAWTVATSTSLRVAEEELAGRIARLELQRMVDVLAGPNRQPSAMPLRPRADGRPDAARPVEPWRAHIAERVRTTLESLHAGVSETDRASLEALAAAAMQARAEAGSAPLCVELRLRVGQLSAAAAARRREAVEATTLLASLHGLCPSGDEPIVRALEDVERGAAAMTDDLRSEVARFSAEARIEADRRYTASVISGALSEMGYEVEEGFDTLVAGSGGAHAARWAAHAVRVQMDGAGELAVRVVRQEGERTSDDQLREDREVEHEFCRDFAQLAARMDSHAVRVRITSHVMPGEEPVETVDRLRARRREARKPSAATMTVRDRPRP